MTTVNPLPSAAVLGPGITPSAVVDKVAGLVLRRGVGLVWLALLGMAATGGLVLTASIVWLFYQGVGTWGVNQPVAWGFAISNYVFWVAIAMGGTFHQLRPAPGPPALADEHQPLRRDHGPCWRP